MIPRRMTDHLAAAIVVHQRWRDALFVQLGEARAGSCEGDLGDDHACALGAWLHGPELAPTLHDTPGWRRVAALHREVHQAASAAQALVDAGQHAAAEALISGRCTDCSQRLVAALQDWRRELALAPALR